MDKKNENVLKVANKYVADLRTTDKPDLWRDYWALEAKLLQQMKGK